MGEYKDAAWYDDAVAKLDGPWPEGTRVYAEAVRRVLALGSPDLFDVGCGPGWFAQALETGGFTGHYFGVDFSAQSIRLARARGLPMLRYRFSLGDLRKVVPTPTLFLTSYFEMPQARSMLVMMDVLEHLEDDQDAMRSVPSGTELLISVPCYDSPAHVRWFDPSDDLLKRYGIAGKQASYERCIFVHGTKA